MLSHHMMLAHLNDGIVTRRHDPPCFTVISNGAHWSKTPLVTSSNTAAPSTSPVMPDAHEPAN